MKKMKLTKTDRVRNERLLAVEASRRIRCATSDSEFEWLAGQVRSIPNVKRSALAQDRKRIAKLLLSSRNGLEAATIVDELSYPGTRRA